MLPSTEEMKNEHQQLRQLLDACERSPADELQTRLERLATALASYQPHKEALYDAARQACRATGDLTGQSLVEIFRNNLVVAVGAVKMLARYTEGEAGRAKMRLRMVAGTLRSLMEADERTVMSIFQRNGTAWRQRAPALQGKP